MPSGGVDRMPRSSYSSYQSSDDDSSSTKFRICLSNLKKKTEITKIYGSEILCDSPYKKKGSLSASERLKEPTLRLNVRSTRGVFDYLGEITYAQTRQKDPIIVTINPIRDRQSKHSNQQNANAILVFNINTPAFDDFAAVTITNGNVYTIPRENSGYSIATINLLGQLVSIVKSPGSIPYSPGILLR
jgi:hypothetical protein